MIPNSQRLGFQLSFISGFDFVTLEIMLKRYSEQTAMQRLEILDEAVYCTILCIYVRELHGKSNIYDVEG